MKAKMKKLLVAAVFTLCLGVHAKADLAKRINGIISRPSQKKVQFSVHIVKAGSGKTVYSHNARKALIPASNMKVITTAAALKYLGPQYEYETKVGLCGDTLVVIGSGDPLLGDKDTDAKYGRKAGWIFQDIIAKLKRKRIRSVKDIIVDSSIFDDRRVHPNWPKKELNKRYACEVSGLNFNGNCIEITTKNTGRRVAVSIEPKTGFVKLTNKVKPISKGSSSVGSNRLPKPNTIVVLGKCRKQAGPFAVAIEKPAAFFGFLLAEHLAKAGIKANGQLIEKPVGDDCKVKVLAEYSTPIADCFTQCNKNSLGLAAEALLKTMSANSNRGGKNGSWAGGQQVISRYLLGLGIDRGQFHIDDGSGLSRHNKLSAYAVAKAISDVYNSRHWKLYKGSLAVGGVDGTVAKYFKDKKYKGKIFGKTGYIAGVKALSGICSTEDGDYIFSILTNNTNGNTRKAINDIAKAIFD
jgi:D-alanyl-D-alanine carboxypeptidase/D-alanyl-D-alanine-endopeptidase (penicillin-binding protein 4)